MTGMFVGLHAALAVQLDTPELMLSDQEGRDFTRAAQNVMRHYSVKANQKTIDWIAFAGITVGIYAPRFAAYKMRKAEEATMRRAAGGQVVVPLRPGDGGEGARGRQDRPARRLDPTAMRRQREQPQGEAAPSGYRPSVPAGPEEEEV